MDITSGVILLRTQYNTKILSQVLPSLHRCPRFKPLQYPGYYISGDLIDHKNSSLLCAPN